MGRGGSRGWLGAGGVCEQLGVEIKPPGIRPLQATLGLTWRLGSEAKDEGGAGWSGPAAWRRRLLGAGTDIWESMGVLLLRPIDDKRLLRPSFPTLIKSWEAGVKAVPLMWGHVDVGLRQTGSRALMAGELPPCGLWGVKPGLWSLLCTQGPLAQGGQARHPLRPGFQSASLQTCAGWHRAEWASLFWAVCSLQSSWGGAINNKETKDQNGTCQGCEAQGCTQLTPAPTIWSGHPGHTGLLVLTGSACSDSVWFSPPETPSPRPLARSLLPCSFGPAIWQCIGVFSDPQKAKWVNGRVQSQIPGLAGRVEGASSQRPWDFILRLGRLCDVGVPLTGGCWQRGQGGGTEEASAARDAPLASRQPAG